jgi:hypothetical protein
MLCTVSTVKDTRANVGRFVERNLASGADHMFLMLEQDDDGLLDLLHDHPHVTAVLTDRDYWHGDPPNNLNVRQVANANLVNCLLAVSPAVEWMVHLDGDECLDLDRDRLAQLPAEVRCIRLEPLEAISREHWDGDVDRFKRLLDVMDLSLLTALGIIDVPSNATYFRGHLQGKLGVRPALDVTVAVHRVRSLVGETLDHLGADYLRLLHYDSYSGEEFVRKWDAHLSGRQAAGFRPSKRLVRAAVAGVQRNPNLDSAARREYLRRIYKRLVEDPEELLGDLGLLVTPDPALHSREPVLFPDDEAELVGSLLQRLVAAPKDAFMAKDDPGAVVRLLRTIRAELGEQDGRLADRMEAHLPDEPAGQGSA